MRLPPRSPSRRSYLRADRDCASCCGPVPQEHQARCRAFFVDVWLYPAVMEQRSAAAAIIAQGDKPRRTAACHLSTAERSPVTYARAFAAAVFPSCRGWRPRNATELNRRVELATSGIWSVGSAPRYRPAARKDDAPSRFDIRPSARWRRRNKARSYSQSPSAASVQRSMCRAQRASGSDRRPSRARFAPPRAGATCGAAPRPWAQLRPRR